MGKHVTRYVSLITPGSWSFLLKTIRERKKVGGVYLCVFDGLLASVQQPDSFVSHPGSFRRRRREDPEAFVSVPERSASLCRKRGEFRSSPLISTLTLTYWQTPGSVCDWSFFCGGVSADAFCCLSLQTLDRLPLTNPEHFGTPVIGKKGNRGRRSNPVWVPSFSSSLTCSWRDAVLPALTQTFQWVFLILRCSWDRLHRGIRTARGLFGPGYNCVSSRLKRGHSAT